MITPRPGRARVPVCGAAYPEPGAYPPPVPAGKAVKLAYTIPAGQAYPAAGPVPADYYYAPTINSSWPADHTVIIGRRAYIQISYTHRRFFARASDVTVRHLRLPTAGRAAPP